MGDYFNKKDQHKNLREFDRLLEDRVVRFTHDNDISTFLKDSKELLNQFCPPTYNMFLLLSATYKNIYKKYSGEFSKMEGDVLFKEISDLAYILYALESQQEIRSNESH